MVVFLIGCCTVGLSINTYAPGSSFSIGLSVLSLYKNIVHDPGAFLFDVSDRYRDTA